MIINKFSRSIPYFKIFFNNAYIILDLIYKIIYSRLFIEKLQKYMKAYTY